MKLAAILIYILEPVTSHKLVLCKNGTINRPQAIIQKIAMLFEAVVANFMHRMQKKIRQYQFSTENCVGRLISTLPRRSMSKASICTNTVQPNVRWTMEQSIRNSVAFRMAIVCRRVLWMCRHVDTVHRFSSRFHITMQPIHTIWISSPDWHRHGKITNSTSHWNHWPVFRSKWRHDCKQIY